MDRLHTAHRDTGRAWERVTWALCSRSAAGSNAVRTQSIRASFPAAARQAVTLLAVTNPGRTEPATKKAHSAPQRRRILQAVSVAGGRVRAEGVFPESETGGNVPQKHSSFSEFLASLKGDDEKP